ncbi:Transcription factor SOX-13 [Gossypium arboreum]|uniref:Transcription factor SOX-13 n=1 Tax=Gossypium arboreum TaxID=29729 RepID=A0A0B0N6E2_GOSAR|nr:Transcription factor SOX-13 [Gossypium arboreum]
MKLCLNEINLKLYRSRTKEIGLGSGKNKNSQIIDLHRSSISEILDSRYKLGDRQQSSSHYLQLWYLNNRT